MFQREYSVEPFGECEGRSGFAVFNGRNFLCFVNDGEGPGHYWGAYDDSGVWSTERKSEAEQIVESLKGASGSLIVGLDYPPQKYRKREVVRRTATGRKNFR